MEKYVAEKKVLAVVELETTKTPSGNVMVEISFEDGTKEIMPKLRYELIVTDKISNASSVQKTIDQSVGSILFATLHEYGILFGEVEEVLNNVSTLTNAGYEKARDITFGVEHRLLPLNQINKILMENNAKQSTNGVTSSGSKSN